MTLHTHTQVLINKYLKCKHEFIEKKNFTLINTNVFTMKLTLNSASYPF